MHPDIDAWQPWDPATFTARMPGADLATARPRMSAAQRDWLRDAVARVHPGHDWASLG
jgi:hypothetical protein